MLDWLLHSPTTTMLDTKLTTTLLDTKLTCDEGVITVIIIMTSATGSVTFTMSV